MENRVLAVNLILSDLVLLSREQSAERTVTVVSGQTGRPVAGAQVHLYQFEYGHPHTRTETQTANASGQVTFKGTGRGSLFVVAQKAGDLALDPQFFSLYRYGDRTEARSALVFTDRSIYRPQQKLLWKIISYHGRSDLGSYKISAGSKVTVLLRDPNSQEVAKLAVTTNEFGTASGEFLIPSGRLLGQLVGKLHRSQWRGPGPGRRVQAPDVRGQPEGSRAGAAAQPRGAAYRRGALLLRTAGDRRRGEVAGQSRGHVSVVVGHVGHADGQQRRPDRGGSGKAPLQPDGTFHSSLLPRRTSGRTSR